ncbi:MAG: CRISPR-associated protein Cas5 [Syntrophobacterales bacterium]|jgi:CRISPR-associated protein Cas5d|nr:CRISPR-associated protein Cas5 [Syntrophobacterales bacterium]
MIEKSYPVTFEIAGPAAMFTRPDTGSSPVSYPAPTQSALKSIFECVAFSKTVYFQPQRVEICSPIVFHKYSTNYKGPMRKSGTSNFQLFATVLENVCYKVHGVVLAYSPPLSGKNPQHQLQEVFMRRLAVGQFHTTPFLGWKEFVPTYFGLSRETTLADESINIIIPSMLSVMYTRPTNGKIAPLFEQNIKIEEGVMHYAERIV